jgi:putative membrane protein
VAVVVSAAAGAISEEEAPVEIGNRPELTAEERERIRLAVQAAERRTKAEIVPMIVMRSGLYREVRHWVGLGFAFLVLTILLTIESHWLPWGWHASNAAWLLLSTLVAYGCGVWLGTLWPVIRLCASAERMRHKVKLRAEQAFSQHAVSHTQERTGVVIMLSILERQIYVLPDQSLVGLASTDQWGQVVHAAVERLQGGDIASGLCQGIERCGLLLAEICPGRQGDNPNELPDTLIQEP